MFSKQKLVAQYEQEFIRHEEELKDTLEKLEKINFADLTEGNLKQVAEVLIRAVNLYHSMEKELAGSCSFEVPERLPPSPPTSFSLYFIATGYDFFTRYKSTMSSYLNRLDVAVHKADNMNKSGELDKMLLAWGSSLK